MRGVLPVKRACFCVGWVRRAEEVDGVDDCRWFEEVEVNAPSN